MKSAEIPMEYRRLRDKPHACCRSVTPHRPINPPDMPAIVTFRTPLRSATLYTYDLDWNLTPHSLSLNGSAIRLPVPDKVVILRLTTGKRKA